MVNQHEWMKVVSSFDQLMGLLTTIRPQEDVALLVNGQHNSYEQFVIRLRQTQGLCADFDGTLHPGSQWPELRTLMGPADAEADLADSKAYHQRDDHDDREDVALILRSIVRLRGVSDAGIHGLMPRLPPRPGALQLLGSFEPRNVAVVSFGIQDLIRDWLICYKMRSDWSQATIFALQLAWKRSPQGHAIDGCLPATVVSNGNKGYCRDIFCATRQIEPSQLLVLGDAPTDVLMMHPQNVGVLIVPKAEKIIGLNDYRKRGLAKLWPRVSAVLVSDSLEQLVQFRGG